MVMSCCAELAHLSQNRVCCRWCRNNRCSFSERPWCLSAEVLVLNPQNRLLHHHIRRSRLLRDRWGSRRSTLSSYLLAPRGPPLSLRECHRSHQAPAGFPYHLLLAILEPGSTAPAEAGSCLAALPPSCSKQLKRLVSTTRSNQPAQNYD